MCSNKKTPIILINNVKIVKEWDKKNGCVVLKGLCAREAAMTDLNQVVVWTVEVFVQLDHQALKKRGELLLLLPRL